MSVRKLPLQWFTDANIDTDVDTEMAQIHSNINDTHFLFFRKKISFPLLRQIRP